MLLPGVGAPVPVLVHNLGAGGNTPPFWLPRPHGLGWGHALFNAYFPWVSTVSRCSRAGARSRGLIVEGSCSLRPLSGPCVFSHAGPRP